MTTTPIRERIDRVKHAVPLLRYLEGLAFQLKRVKEGQWQTLCPFHSEKTPSFHIFEKDHHYHCYGCGAHGDIVDFVEATKGCSKVEALQMLEQDAPGLRFLNAAPQSGTESPQSCKCRECRTCHPRPSWPYPHQPSCIRSESHGLCIGSCEGGL